MLSPVGSGALHARHVMAGETVFQRSPAACTLRHVPADSRGGDWLPRSAEPAAAHAATPGDRLDGGRPETWPAGSTSPLGRVRVRAKATSALRCGPAHVPNQLDLLRTTRSTRGGAAPPPCVAILPMALGLDRHCVSSAVASAVREPPSARLVRHGCSNGGAPAPARMR